MHTKGHIASCQINTWFGHAARTDLRPLCRESDKVSYATAKSNYGCSDVTASITWWLTSLRLLFQTPSNAEVDAQPANTKQLQAVINTTQGGGSPIPQRLESRDKTSTMMGVLWVC